MTDPPTCPRSRRPRLVRALGASKEWPAEASNRRFIGRSDRLNVSASASGTNPRPCDANTWVRTLAVVQRCGLARTSQPWKRCGARRECPGCFAHTLRPEPLRMTVEILGGRRLRDNSGMLGFRRLPVPVVHLPPEVAGSEPAHVGAFRRCLRINLGLRPRPSRRFCNSRRKVITVWAVHARDFLSSFALRGSGR